MSSGTNDSSTWCSTETKALVRFDELSGSIEGQTLVGLHEFPDPSDTLPFDEHRMVWTICHLPVGTETSLGCGKPGCQNSVSAMVGSSTASYGSALSFRDPDNIALEFFTPAL